VKAASLTQQLRQLGDVGGDATRLVAGEELDGNGLITSEQ
jgi:hypothetical protein